MNMMKKKGLKGLMMKAALKPSGDQAHPFPPKKPAGFGGLTSLASDVGSKLKQAKAAGIDTSSVGSVENLYRITKFLEKAGENVGASKAHTAKAQALKEKLAPKRSDRAKKRVRTIDELRATKIRPSVQAALERDEHERQQRRLEEEHLHSLKLGNVSRFGDGDGTYWDRWLGMGDKGGDSSWSRGWKAPLSGFKRLDSGAVATAELSDLRPLPPREKRPKDRAPPDTWWFDDAPTDPMVDLAEVEALALATAAAAAEGGAAGAGGGGGGGSAGGAGGGARRQSAQGGTNVLPPPSLLISTGKYRRPEERNGTDSPGGRGGRKRGGVLGGGGGLAEEYCPRPCKTCTGAKEFKSSATLRQNALVYIRRNSYDDEAARERMEL
jgi:hypothetical protein